MQELMSDGFTIGQHTRMDLYNNQIGLDVGIDTRASWPSILGNVPPALLSYWILE